MDDFVGKVAVVTGAASGIGLAMCKRFASAGMKVVMADVEVAALDEAVAQVAGHEGSNDAVLAVPTDVSDAAAVDALAAKTLEHFGAVHVLCNNAGVGGGVGRLWTIPAKEWEWVLSVNLWGVIHGVRAFVPHMVAQNEGHVVNTASIAGLTSFGGLGAYNVSKHGVVTLSETLFAELQQAGKDVSVSVLCPGAVDTRIHDAHRNQPQHMQGPPRALSPAQEKERKERYDMMAAILAAGQAPADVAEKVFAAIEARTFYILTHPEMTPAVEDRMRRILEGEDPTGPPLPPSAARS